MLSAGSPASGDRGAYFIEGYLMRISRILRRTGKPHILAFDGYWWRFTFTKCGLYIESEKLSETGD